MKICELNRFAIYKIRIFSFSALDAVGGALLVAPLELRSAVEYSSSVIQLTRGRVFLILRPSAATSTCR